MIFPNQNIQVVKELLARVSEQKTQLEAQREKNNLEYDNVFAAYETLLESQAFDSTTIPGLVQQLDAVAARSVDLDERIYVYATMIYRFEQYLETEPKRKWLKHPADQYVAKLEALTQTELIKTKLNYLS